MQALKAWPLTPLESRSKSRGIKHNWRQSHRCHLSWMWNRALVRKVLEQSHTALTLANTLGILRRAAKAPRHTNSGSAPWKANGCIVHHLCFILIYLFIYFTLFSLSISFFLSSFGRRVWQLQKKNKYQREFWDKVWHERTEESLWMRSSLGFVVI